MQDIKIKEEDADLAYFFKNFEEILIAPKKQGTETISSGVDFRVFKEYLIDDIKEILQQLIKADDEYLLYVCEHIYNITDWITLIVGNRSRVFSEALEEVFDQNFEDKHILQNIYRESLESWISSKKGQYKLGGNIYSILNEKIYYRNRFNEWFEVSKETAFDLQPSKEPIQDKVLAKQLDNSYEDTWYDAIIKEWENKDYSNVLPADFLEFDKEITSPEEYFEFTLEHIKLLLEYPISIAELEQWSGGKIADLEDTIKLCSMALAVVKKRRSDQSHTIYLLRDCMVFYEIHKTLDLLKSEETSSDQLMIGRKLLSHQPDQWGYYIVVLEALYEAHLRYPNNYDEFYEEFARLLDLFVMLNPQFKTLIDDLSIYIKKHNQTSKNRTVVFDVGFQGSINLFIKYIIDYHINPSSSEHKVESEIEVSIGALWSKKLFGERAKGYYFPFLNRIQYMVRSDELYNYNFGSLNSGEIRVTMGNKESQKKAAIELAVLVMVTRLTEQ